MPNIVAEIPKKVQRPSIGKAKRDYGKALAQVLKHRFVDHLSYPDIAALMARQGGPLTTEKTVAEACREFSPLMDRPGEAEAFRDLEVNLIDGVRKLMVQGMAEQLLDPERRKTLDLSRLTYGYGILYDKMRLERGESTMNIKTLSDLVREAHARPVGTVSEAEVVGES